MNPYFVVAMQAADRQRSFRRAVIGHVIAVSALAIIDTRLENFGPPGLVGYLTLIIGLIEGAALIGWRLTQIPKSQALEFLLVSPIRPRNVFWSEAIIGILRFLFVQLTGLPIFLMSIGFATEDYISLVPYIGIPAIWGIVTGLLLTAWVYEPLPIRRLGELAGLFGVLIYLIVGLLAGEHLKEWLESLPHWLGQFLFEVVMAFHQCNPFGLVNYFFETGSVKFIFWERFSIIHGLMFFITAFAGWRAANRLQGHFQDRHYSPQFDERPDEIAKIGDRPLTWWAVRRVMEYSGRVNLWLAGGVALLYSLRILAGDSWPPQLGNLVFIIFDQWGGPSGMATVLCVLACVPAVFQYGLWDATPSDRCKRLELLLLSELDGKDYASAAFAASWARGKGYLFSAVILWLSLGLSGRNSWIDVFAAMFGGVLLFALSFAVGYRAFATGNQSSGIASIMTIGLPISLVVCIRWFGDGFAAILPHGWCYLPLRSGVSMSWFGGIGVGTLLTIWLIYSGINRCVHDLQSWYDRNHGRKTTD